jgi:2-polyprenyl-3-methyl-5-hydroxy-6-metoxy-1,4-benzoquinol methylase
VNVWDQQFAILHAHKTAIQRRGPSAPVRLLLERGWVSGTVLDLGCGRGADVRHLSGLGFDVTASDSFYVPLDLEGRVFDTVLSIYVLNVLPVEVEDEVLTDARSHVAPGGSLYIATRNDVKVDGFTRSGTFQRRVRLEESMGYRSVRLTGRFSLWRWSNRG